MEKFLLLFRNKIAEENAFQELSPEDMQAEIAKWNVWIGGKFRILGKVFLSLPFLSFRRNLLVASVALRGE